MLIQPAIPQGMNRITRIADMSVAADQQVVQDSHAPKQPKVLERTRHAAWRHLVRLEVRQILVRKADGATAGLVDTTNTMKDGRFACAVRTDAAVNRALLDCQ